MAADKNHDAHIRRSQGFVNKLVAYRKLGVWISLNLRVTTGVSRVLDFVRCGEMVHDVLFRRMRSVVQEVSVCREMFNLVPCSDE